MIFKGMALAHHLGAMRAVCKGGSHNHCGPYDTNVASSADVDERWHLQGLQKDRPPKSHNVTTDKAFVQAGTPPIKSHVTGSTVLLVVLLVVLAL